jgi:excisionase family DNA binding protein
VSDEAIAPAQQRLVYSICEAANALNLSRATIYRLLSRRKIASIKIGSRRLIPCWSILVGRSMTSCARARNEKPPRRFIDNDELIERAFVDLISQMIARCVLSRGRLGAAPAIGCSRTNSASFAAMSGKEGLAHWRSSRRNDERQEKD